MRRSFKSLAILLLVPLTLVWCEGSEGDRSLPTREFGDRLPAPAPDPDPEPDPDPDPDPVDPPPVPIEPSSVFENNLRLVDEVVATEGPGGEHELYEDPVGASEIQTILNRPARVLVNSGGPRVFAYRLGKNKGIVPGRAYVLSVEFPEDQPRTVWVINRGGRISRGFHTGNTVGDVLHGRWVHGNPESVDLPLSGEYRTWRQFFHLHDRTSDIHMARDDDPHPNFPDDGFWVIIAQSSDINQPMSAGAAVSRIQLHEVIDPEAEYLTINYPPDGLPRRHVFYRMEMNDQTLEEASVPALADGDYYEYHARLMRVLGIDTFSKDLLEFGFNQGWESATPQWDGDWFYQPLYNDRWDEIIRIAAGHGLNVMPYFEYYGSLGADPNIAIGTQKRAEPLAGPGDYTELFWLNNANCDVTDPEFVDEAKRVLDKTIVRYKDDVDFVGAWFRNRPGAWPVSFADAARARFAADRNGGAPVSRSQLQSDSTLLERYYEWWFERRRDFLRALRDHLRTEVDPSAVVLLTLDWTEGAYGLGQGKFVVTDDPSPWQNLLGLSEHQQNGWLTTYDRTSVIDNGSYLDSVLSWLGSGTYEWNHAAPPADPASYQSEDGIQLTFPMFRSFTVARSSDLDLFRGQGGLAVVKNYFLNEDELEDKTGYFVADMDYAGPYEMITEAMAMANGDPRFIGYLSSNDYNRGFPEYVRAFNAAFLSLPALPSRVVAGATSDPEIVVREIRTDGHETYYAIVNLGTSSKHDVELTLPAASPTYVNTASGLELEAGGGSLTLSFYPFELKAIRTGTGSGGDPGGGDPGSGDPGGADPGGETGGDPGGETGGDPGNETGESEGPTSTRTREGLSQSRNF